MPNGGGARRSQNRPKDEKAPNELDDDWDDYDDPKPPGATQAIIHKSGLKRAFFDITIGGASAGRVVFELFDDTVPKTANNFLSLCVGDNAKKLTYQNQRSKSSGRRRPPRTIRVVAAARNLRGLAASWPRRRRETRRRGRAVTDYSRRRDPPPRMTSADQPRRSRGVAATRIHGIAASWPRRRRDAPPRPASTE